MDKSAAAAYVYAKASGMLARSFVGPNVSKLFSVKSLNELWSLLFDSEVPNIPEALLAHQIEIDAEKKFINQYIKLLSNYSNPDAVLVSLLRFYEYENVKQIGAALCFKETELPHIIDIGKYNSLDYGAWPDLAKITANSSISWYNKIPSIHEQQINDTKLDQQYVVELWNAIHRLPVSEREPVEKILREEFTLRNIIWVMRLRVYYNMKEEDIIQKLAYVSASHDEDDEIAGKAIKIINKPIDSYAEWKGWEYESLLNPNEEGTVWKLDPRWVEGMARKRNAKTAQRMFHRYPESACVLLCWFKLKYNELNCIRTIAEGMRMNVDSKQVMALSGLDSASLA